MISITIHDDNIQGALQDLTVSIDGDMSLNQCRKVIWKQMKDLLLSWRNVRKDGENGDW